MSSFCAGCGNSLSEGDSFCSTCGRAISATSASPPQDPGVAFGLPPETSGKAIFSLVCGVLCFFPPSAIAAVLFGHLSLSEIRRSAGRLGGRGLAITGMVLGYSGLAAISVLLIVATLKAPKILRQSMRAGQFSAPATIRGIDQPSAVAALRTLNTAEIAYAQAHPASGYTCSLSELSEVWGIGDLSHGRKNGYVFALQGCAATKANGPIGKYQVLAYPAAPNTSRLPAYCSNESDRVKIARDGSSENCLEKGADLLENEINHPQPWPQNSSR